MNYEHEFHEVMSALRTMYSDMKHGLCDPPSRRACTRCAAERKVAQMVAEYKGPRIVLASQSSGSTDAELKALEPLYDQAVLFARSEPTTSVSKMQRQFRIGYNRAARLCERLAEEGVLILGDAPYTYRRATAEKCPNEL